MPLVALAFYGTCILSYNTQQAYPTNVLATCEYRATDTGSLRIVLQPIGQEVLPLPARQQPVVVEARREGRKGEEGWLKVSLVDSQVSVTLIPIGLGERAELIRLARQQAETGSGGRWEVNGVAGVTVGEDTTLAGGRVAELTVQSPGGGAGGVGRER